MRIPGIGRINKKISIFFGDHQKMKFEKFIGTQNFRNILKNKLQSKIQVNLELVTFTNSKCFPDLLLSILSFINSAGIPAKWTVYADDEFSESQKDIFKELDFLVLIDWFTNVELNEKEKYKSKWQFRKYLSFSTHLFTTTTIFLDSDVLFYPQFNRYKEFIGEDNWYLPEPTDAFSIDKAILKSIAYKQTMFIINSGFIILNKTPLWKLGLEYLSECLANNSTTHFSEQSAINIVYCNDCSAKVLEPRVFHVSTVDHFKAGFLNTSDLAIRHYVGPVRYKMW